MRVARGAMGVFAAAALAVGMAAVGVEPASATPQAAGGGAAWHWVHEGWQPAPQDDAVYPAARYCRTFDLGLTPVSQDVRQKVLSRWANGNPKDRYYTGPLTMRAENLTTGKAKNYDMGGDALETDYPTGKMHIYRTFGQVGVGMPVGASKGLPPSDYVMDGYHVLRFNADGSQRTLTVKLGTETDVCAALR